jgi:6-phospho-3-hexuloisomerase
MVVTTDTARAELQLILDEVSAVAADIDFNLVSSFVQDLIDADRVYIAGQGRSGLAGQGLAQRLMHNGLTAYVVGQVVVPAVAAGDLCVAIAASGKTATTLHQAQRAKAAGARLIAVTQPGESPLAELADWTLVIPSRTPGGAPTQQHATTLFCQVVQLLFDSVCRLVQSELGQKDEDLHRRHTNFE